MEIVPYFVHPEVARVAEVYKLDLFNMENYIFDDIHENHEYLQTLDPREWKNQDHYAVLRLRKVRLNASQELIKQAYRKQLLDHHPDKGKQRLRKCDDESNDYFTCITKAFDLLKDPLSRISYDSVDPTFDNEIPTSRDAKERFYEAFGPVFERNVRWSKIQPVPLLGDDEAEYDEVHQFYCFWDDFRSWREFSYWDEESKQQADSRDERRYIDKLNKVERKKKSQEESKRISNLVQLAKLNDPRISRYNEKRKAEKDAEKKAKADRKLEIRMAAEKVVRDEREKLEKEEAEKQQKLKDEMTNMKKQKDQIKNKQKAEKRKLRKLVETYNYFVNIFSQQKNMQKSPEMQKAEMMNVIDTLCLKMSVDELTVLNEELERVKEEEMVNIIKTAEEMLSGKSEVLKHMNQKNTVSNTDHSGTLNKCGDREWNFELSQFLIRAINLHPPGTVHRWYVIAEYMNVHHADLHVKEKQVIHRAKMLKSDDSVLKKEAAIHNLTTKADLSIDQNLNNVRITDRNEVINTKNIWTIEEQKLLEVALKSIPNTDPARWDKISECVKTRSKKECMLRYKECAEKMKAKKAAQ